MAEKNDVDEWDLKEIEGIIKKELMEPKKKEASIIFDGRQYSIRIPKKFAESVNIDKDNDKFIFELEIPKEFDKKPILKGYLIKK